MRYREFRYIDRLAESQSTFKDYHFTDRPNLMQDLMDFVKSGKIRVNRGAQDGKDGQVLTLKNPEKVLKQIKAIQKKILAGEGTASKLLIDIDDPSGKIKANKISRHQVEGMVVQNVGTVLEGLTGIAVATLLAKRGDVTKDNMKMIATQLAPSGSSITTERGLQKDKIQFKFTGATQSDVAIVKDLIAYNFDISDKKAQQQLNKKYKFSKDAIQKLINQCDIVVKYANTGRAPLRALEKFRNLEFRDDVVQTITVQSDGGDTKKQSVTKVDLEIVTQDPTKGSTREKLTSIKSGSGSHQGGQVSGKTFKVLNRFWVSSLFFKLPPVFKKGFDQKNVRDILDKGIKPTYHFAQKQAKKLLAQDVDANERQFLKNMQLGLKYHLQMDDPKTKAGSDDVTIFVANTVKNTKEYNELQFNDENFLETLKFFDLEVSEVNENANDVNFQITAKLSPKIKDIKQLPQYVQSMMKKGQVPGKYLAMYRSKIESGGSLRNTVWIGQQAEVLANVKNQVMQMPQVKEPAQAKPQQPAKIPTPTPPQNKTAVQPQGTI